MTPFSKIKEVLLNDITNRDFALISNDDLTKYLDNLIIMSANADFINCTKDLSKYTESDIITLTEGYFDEDLNFQEINIIEKYTLLRYLNKEINSQDLLRQDIGDKDFRLSSGWQLLNSLLKLKESTLVDIERLEFNYQYNSANASDFC